MKQLFKRGTAWLLCLAMLLGLCAGVPGVLLNHAHAEESTDPSADAINLLADYNASFEDYTISGWSIEAGVAQSRDKATEGNAWSLKINLKDAAATSDAVAITEGFIYNASVKVFGAGKVTILFYDEQNAVIGEASAEASTADWEILTASAAAPAGAASAAVKLSATTGEAVYFDDAAVTRGEASNAPVLLNGSLDEWNAKGTTPVNWSITNPADGTYAAGTAEAVEGRGNVVTFVRDNHKMQIASDKFDVIGGKAYTISFDAWMDVANTVQIYVQAWDADNKAVTPANKHGISHVYIRENATVNEWGTISYTAALPANAVKARILVTAPWAATGTFKMDNAKVALSNEVFDGSFEGTPDGIGMSFGFTSSTINATNREAWINTDAEFVRTGAQSAKFNSNKWMYSNYINVTPGETYESTLYIKTTTEAAAAWKSSLVNLIYFYDANGVELSKKQAGAAATTEWKAVTVSAVAPEGAAFANVLYYSAGGVMCYGDDFSVKQTTNVLKDVEALNNSDFEAVSVKNHAIFSEWTGSQYNNKAEETMEIVYDVERGGYVARLNPVCGQVWLSAKRFPTKPGEQFTASAKFSGTSGYAQFYIRFHKTVDTGAAITSTNEPSRGYAQTINFNAESEGWINFSDHNAKNLQGEKYIQNGQITLTAPAEANWVTVLIVAVPEKDADGNYTYADICVDDVSLTKVAEHTYITTTQDATCTQVGTTTYTCACGDSYSEEIPALGHAWNEGEITTAPSCTDEGVKTYTCATCGETKTEAVSAKGHTAAEAVKENNADPDCENEGSYDLVVYCADCGAELSRETFTVDALGHKYEASVTKPTCTDKGYTTYTCAVCGDSYTADEVAALGHAWNEGEITTAPSCTDEGVKTYTCATCGETKTEAVSAKGHTAAEAVKENNADPNCENEGSYDLVVYCADCGAELSRETFTVDALGHKYEASVTAPTCTAEGYTTYTCACGDSYTADEVVALGHAWNEGEITTAPSCTDEGVKTYTCATCGETKTEAVSAKGHTAAEAVKENNADPDCENEGSYDLVVYCADCGAELSRETFTVDALGHKYEASVTKPTCTDKGYTTYTCAVCGDSYTADEVAALGHTAGAAVKENWVSPSNTSDGSYDLVTYCTVCGAELSRETIVTKMPNASVTVKDPMILTPEDNYMCWPSGDKTVNRPLQIVMNFKANDTLEECLAGPFSKYLVDFYLTFEGLENGQLTADNCYLAGNYGTFGWIVIPTDGLVLESGISYPVVSAYDATLNYKDICKSVKDFTAAIYVDKAVLEANPNFTVKLELKMTNPENADDVIVVGDPAIFTADDLNAGNPKLPDASVTVKDPMVLTPEDNYICWPSGDKTVNRPLQIVMNFKANETLEEAKAGMYGKYLVDFYLTIEGLENGQLTADNCYLAGNYGSFGWIVIPTDGLVLENGICYPIVSAYDASLNYEDICGSVKDFTAAIYIDNAILEANPNFTVKLELKMTNPKDAEDVLVIGEPAIFTADDLKAGNPEEEEPERADDLVFVQAPSLSFQDYIGMQVMINSALLNNYDEIYVEAIQMDPEKGAIATKLNGFLYFYDMFYVFDQQILSWSMAENVTLTLYGVKDGKTFIGQTYSASVEDLALTMLEGNANGGNAKLCTVLVDMLNYGATVQTVFEHNETLLPNTKLADYASFGTTEVPAMDAEVIKNGTGSVVALQDSISMQSKVELQLLFIGDISAYTAKAVVNGEEKAVVIDTESMAALGGTVVRVAVGAAEMRETFTIALYDAEGNAVTTVYEVSVEAYAKVLLGGSQNDVAVTMMRYGDAVAAFAAG